MKNRLAWPLAISLLLHAVVLTQVRLPAPTSAQHRLTVSLESLSSAHPKKIAAHNNLSLAPANSGRLKEQAEKKNYAEETTPNPAKIPIPNPAETKGSDTRLDMNQLLNQAREYATTKEFRTSEPAFTLIGEYYGTYTGSDNGEFSVHLDSTWHAYGWVRSYTLDAISFPIMGSVMPNGMAEMTSMGSVDGARFKGRLDIKTRKISGTWSWGVANGTFSGQHE